MLQPRAMALARLCTLAFALLGVEAFAPPRAHFAPKLTRTGATTDVGDAIACYGRVADKMFVVKPDEVEGTAASGYEFGILQAGKPKWLCTYSMRKGLLQGGGNEVIHRPAWRSLFGADGVLEDRAALGARLAERAHAMPLGAPSGAGAKATAPPPDAAVAALWKLLGGSGCGCCALEASKAEASLRAAAEAHSSDADQLNFKAFAAAFEGASA